MNLTQTVTGGEPVRIVSQMPSRDNADSNTYTCLFGMKQKVTDTLSSEDNIVQTALTGTPEYYFMAGTNTQGSPITVGIAPQLEKTGEKLADCATQTQNLSQATPPWQNFPYTSSLSGDQRLWNPLKYYCAKSNAC